MPTVEDGYDLLGLLVYVGVPVLGAAWAGWLTWKAKRSDHAVASLRSEVSRLRTQVTALERERDEIRHLFRMAVQHIREWLAWARDHQHGEPQPELPDELKSEV